MDFVPSISVQQLSITTPGTLVSYDGKYAFTYKSSAGPKVTLLAELDTAARCFTHRFFETDRDILSFGTQFIVEPDLSTSISISAPTANSGTSIFFDGRNAYVVVRTDGQKEWRVLEVDKGVARSGAGPAMASFSHWRIGLRSPWGPPIPLLTI